MRQLPQVVSGTRELIDNGRLKMVTASYDRDRQALLDVIKERGIRYPVIWQNNDPNRGNTPDWNIRGIPTTVLINPQGEIVADLRAGEDFQQVLEYFIDNGEALGVMDMNGSAELQEDGTVKVDLSMYSSQHTDMDVNVEVYRVVFKWDEENDPEHKGRPLDREYISLADEGQDYSFTQKFRWFANEDHSFVISDFGEADSLYVMASVTYPGSEELNEGEGVGVSFGRNIALP
ncbi:hypothetical protein KDL44_05585 [bacterium]|nr:hypothetical protein [bacterium]